MVRSKMSFGAHQSSKWCAPKPRTVRTAPSKPMQQSYCRWALAAVGKREFGLCGVVGVELLAYTMRSIRGRIAAVGSENYCGNLLW